MSSMSLVMIFVNYAHTENLLMQFLFSYHLTCVIKIMSWVWRETFGYLTGSRKGLPGTRPESSPQSPHSNVETILVFMSDKSLQRLKRTFS